MHAAMQPPEKGGTELPPRGVRLHHWWPPWPPPSCGRFISGPRSLTWLRMDLVRCFGGLFHLSLTFTFSEYAFLKCAFSCVLRLSTCHT